MRMQKAIATGMLALAVAVGSVACSGSGKPSKAEIANAFKANASQLGGAEAEMLDKMADCMANELHPKLSDEGARAIVNQDDNYEPSEADQKVLLDAISKCGDDFVSDLGLGGN